MPVFWAALSAGRLAISNAFKHSGDSVRESILAW
jgi:hypothetical protein